MRHVPRQRFSQNFLIDEAVSAGIVSAIDPQPDDLVMEIGPGLGAITRPLLARLKHLHAVEIDRDIVARLKQVFPAHRLSIHEGDVLEFDFAALGPDLRVVGNLPYHISTPILFHLAHSARNIRDIHVMLQQEVVDRMVARPSTPEYGRLSVMLQYRFQLDRVLDVPAEAFRPAPRVESAVVRLLPRNPEVACDEALLGKLVMRAFAQRRKTLRNTLKGVFDAEDFVVLDLDAGARAENLAVTDFARAANHLARKQSA
ncbi:MAG: 16S rRNA (adenine(1518)-N(6)/adenine(1519)-N(6))-dimethyltransferase RsmA [Burkholderiales bacterium]|nr:16S rRNA (adenine(1518)-N(6)/adenine(1519)-N(6))-dimethyltransferase RsmA [Burkholderiales bacterium]